MKITDTTTPVLVLESPHHGGLGVTRSLGRLGIPVFNLDADRWAPAFFSRYCGDKFVWDLGNALPQSSVEYLDGLARKLDRRCILIPTTDTAAIFVAQHAKLLQERYIFPVQSGAVVSLLCNKKELSRLAGDLAVPAPRTACPESGRELRACRETLDFPVVIKEIGGRPGQPNSKAKLVIRTKAEFDRLCDLVGDAQVDNLIVQEHISGAEWMFNGYFNERSECLVAFTGRKLRQCPIYTGGTSLGVCGRNEAVEEIAKTLMKALDYRGMLDVDFRYDVRDGQYKVLDVNPRIGSTFRLFVAENGMDVVRAFYLDLTGQPVPAAVARNGRKWVVEDFDLAASFRYRRDGTLRLPEWWRSLRGVQESAFFAWDDPLPLLLMLRSDLGELARRAKLRPRPKLPFEYRRAAPEFASNPWSAPF